MATKWLNSSTVVDLTQSRRVWDNGVDGDAHVALWADAGNVHVWAETNGDPVYGVDSLSALLVEEGLDASDVQRICDGDLSAVGG